MLTLKANYNFKKKCKEVIFLHKRNCFAAGCRRGRQPPQADVASSTRAPANAPAPAQAARAGWQTAVCTSKGCSRLPATVKNMREQLRNILWFTYLLKKKIKRRQRVFPSMSLYTTVCKLESN